MRYSNTYDRSGNLLTLDRYGASSGTSPTESLSYTYSGPKRTTWTYDAHANVTADPQGGLSIAWNAIDLPRTLTTGAGTGAAPGASYLDFGARLYSPRTATWLSPDPLMEKYYGISPFVYCVGNPVNIVDTDGKDWYIINQSGEFRLIERRPNEEFDRLFVDFFMGPPDMTTSIIVRDREILSSLSESQRASYSVSHNDIEKIFYFVADSFMEQEWGLYTNGKKYAIVTSGSSEEVGSPFDNTTWKIHSHSDTQPTDKDEIQSMGYWFYYENRAFNAAGKLIDNSSPWYVANRTPNDLDNLLESKIPSIVYFPMSGHVYRMNENTLPTLIKTRHK